RRFGHPRRAESRFSDASRSQHGPWRLAPFVKAHSLSFERVSQAPSLYYPLGVWAAFAAMVSFKAAWAGRSFIAVNPAYTSQDCRRWGPRQKVPLTERV